MLGYLTPFQTLWTWRDREGSRRGRRSEQTQEMVALLVVLLSAQLHRRLWQAFWLRDSSFFCVPLLPALLLPVPICQIGLNTYTRCTRPRPSCAVDVSYGLDHLTLPDSHKVRYQPQKWCCAHKCFSPVGMEGVQFLIQMGLVIAPNLHFNWTSTWFTHFASFQMLSSLVSLFPCTKQPTSAVVTHPTWLHPLPVLRFLCLISLAESKNDKGHTREEENGLFQTLEPSWCAAGGSAMQP